MHGEFIFRQTKSRAKLVRLCQALTGDRDAAEDLAQETLVEAWRHRNGLRDPEAADAWVAGIARNVCRRWHRHRGREQARPAPPEPDRSAAGAPWQEMERAEQAALLGRAMGLLTPEARQALTAHYWDDLSLSETAARAGITENTAAVRLGRARGALRTALTTRLAADAAIFGLTVPEDGWRETRIWCFRCGRRRLEERRAAGAEFGVRCPQCDDKEDGDVAFSTGHAAMDAAQVLGTVQTCKPALRRVNAWWDSRLRHGLDTGRLPCWRCAGVMVRQASGEDRAVSFGLRLSFGCRSCGAEFSLPASGLAFHSEAVQRFWQRHPRIRVLPERRVEGGGGPLIVTRYEAVGEAASVETVYDANSFQSLI